MVSVNHPDSAGAIESRVARHYAQTDLEKTILDALTASGKDIGRLQPSDLSAVDEFHTGGRQATIDFAAAIGFSPDLHILDVGCGIGGPSRYFATEQRCRVTGVDLTEDYVQTAEALSRRVGLSRIGYRQASALALPFGPATFAGAYMMHVGMNIADKPALFAEIHRVLEPGSRFGLFDVMRKGAGALRFPLHWAAEPETSFVASPEEYREALQAAGFDIIRERDRADFARSFFQQAAARAAEQDRTPPLGTHILMKDAIPEKIRNYLSSLEAGVIAPVEIVCRAL
jgi:ubiquinone/menaquinone biosynthesis C-methylase UbiE